MGCRGAATLALLILGCVVSSVVGTVEDGIPRPANYPDAPTATYGPTPALVDSNGVPVDCQWYGWANTLYDATTGASCLEILRMALTNATVNPPATLQAYKYYTIKRLIDTTNNQSYCYEGCFNLANSLAPSPSPLPLSPPIPTPDSALPPTLLTPTPSADTPVLAPNSALPPTLLTPTPSADTPLLAPNSALPPTVLTPAGPVAGPIAGPVAGSPGESPYPVNQPVPYAPGSLATPSDAAPALPPSLPESPPAPPAPTTVLNLNGGTIFVAPSAFASCVVVVAVALVLNLADRR